jgi:hypothetical protein
VAFRRGTYGPVPKWLILRDPATLVSSEPSRAAKCPLPLDAAQHSSSWGFPAWILTGFHCLLVHHVACANHSSLGFSYFSYKTRQLDWVFDSPFLSMGSLRTKG